MRIRFLLTGALVLGLAARPAAAQGARYVVVVNASSPVATLKARELARIFKKDVTRWDDGSAITPVDQPPESSIRADFSQRVLGKPTSAMVAFWQQQIFSGRSVPPVERKSDSEVLDYVTSHPGAIGYVSAGARLPSEVKAIAVQ